MGRVGQEKDEKTPAPIENTAKGLNADNEEHVVPKLTKATEFENSVSEIERLLGIGEVKLPKVGAAKQNI